MHDCTESSSLLGCAPSPREKMQRQWLQSGELQAQTLDGGAALLT